MARFLYYSKSWIQLDPGLESPVVADRWGEVVWEIVSVCDHLSSAIALGEATSATLSHGLPLLPRIVVARFSHTD